MGVHVIEITFTFYYALYISSVLVLFAISGSHCGCNICKIQILLHVSHCHYQKYW